jgi:anti-anti-sigma factor
MAAEANERQQRSVPGTVTVTFAGSNGAHVALRGEWDISTERLLADALTRAREQRQIVIDLSDCSFLDSRAIGMLLSLGAELAENTGHLAVVLPSSQSTVVRAFELLGIREVLSVHDTLEDAQRGLPTTPPTISSAWLAPSPPMPVD